MKNRKQSVRRLLAWSILCSFVLGMLPVSAFTDGAVSDWVLPVDVRETLELTEDVAEIGVTVSMDGETLEDGDTVAPGAGLTAAVSVRLKDSLPLADSLIYTLPGSVRADDTDWAALTNGGRWRIEGGRAVIDLSEAALEDGAGFDFAFAFIAGEAGDLAFTGKAAAIRVEEPKNTALDFAGKDFSVRLCPSGEDVLPKDAELRVEERTDTGVYLLRAANTLGITPDKVRFLRVFDLSVWADGKEIEPEGRVRVDLSMAAEGDRIVALHFEDDVPQLRTMDTRKAAQAAPGVDVLKTEITDGGISFETDHFSVYAVLGYSLETVVEAGDGNTYRITVTYGPEAEIPDGAALDVREVPSEAYLEATAEALDWGGDDEVFYTKFLDVSIVYEGRVIEPKAPVFVSIELMDVTDGAEALEVVHFADDGSADKVESTADGDGTVTFTADSFSVYGVGSVLRSLLSWTNDAVDYTLQGFSALLNPTYTAVTVSMEEGLEAINAYRVQTAVEGLRSALRVRVSAAPELADRESVAVYAVRDGAIGELLAEGETIDESVPLRDAGGFAVVRDTGYRRLVFELGAVELNGMMPKGAEAEAADVTGEYEGYTFAADEEPHGLPDEDPQDGADEEAADPEAESSEDNPAGDGSQVIAAYDITITDSGNEYQPDEDHPVQVGIDLGGEPGGEIALWHIRDDGTAEAVTGFTVEAGVLRFEATGFSVYVVTEMPEPVVFTETAVQVTDLLSPRADGGFYLSVKQATQNENYWLSTIVTQGGNSVIKESVSEKSVWYFEAVDGANAQFRIYTMVDGAKKYIKQTSAGNKNVQLADTGTVFTVSAAEDGRFLIKHASENLWLQHSGSGRGIRFWEDTNNHGNSRVLLTFVEPSEDERDPYGLDGRSYGIMNRKNEISAYAVMDTAVSGNTLAAKEMLIRTDPMNQSNTLAVAKDSDITMWTFESIENDLYYLKSGDKYLRIANNHASLVDEPNDSCVIRVIPGTGENAGKLLLLSTESGKVLTLAGNNKSFTGTGNTASAASWHNLVEYSVYTEEDFVQYTGHKVSVSDGENVANGKQVVIYTRVWNEAEKKYEFYAVDHNGDLLPCYESGDSIVWIGTRINTVLWDYTEYFVPGTTSQNGYYELRNTYTGEYVAPQLNGGQIFADSPVGINLNGRYYGDYYTTILAWDDSHYDYAGYKVENGHIVPCPMAEADTFYFAVMDPSEHELTPVETVDHIAHGITMKMVDCDSRQAMSNIIGNNDGGMGQALHQGLLSTQLAGGPDGYPTTRAGRSLADLYSGETEVNHLFIKSIYEGSGYYQYDSSENFAELNGSEFTVYQELGSVGSAGPTHAHGQFMPYNTLTGNVHPNNPYNKTDIYGNELSDNYPRKYEPLYGYEEADNSHFAMELTGSFVQPPNGHDAWGHDIIFDFVGDDDFWLYVDGELVIDLGGIHSAVPGSVNYSTGDVYVNGTHTTLRDLFYNNYLGRGHSAAEAQAYVNGLFREKEVDGRTCYVFNDYSSHTVRIFYMERGAGASNLRMRFNLSTVTPGQVLLHKEITGTTKKDFASMRVPYQIYYQDEEGGGYRLLDRGDFGSWHVVYQNTTTPVEYSPSAEIDGVTYENVFYLKPGQTAAIKMPENTISYYIVECGVDTSIYDSVSINDVPAEGVTPEGATKTQTFTTTPATALERARVSYSNHVDPSQLRTMLIHKRLFDADGHELSADQDSTGFSLRMRFGDDLAYYNQGEYYVKDPHGNYCYYDPQTQMFASIGVTDFDALTAEQLPRVTFRTSPSGAASKIPADYRIEVRELLVGTKFLITEEDYEIPVGYGKRTWTEGGITYHGYKRVEGSYLVEPGEEPNEGIIRDNSNPELEIHNQRGWGILARKVWSDADFILRHDDIYFAVYVNGTLLPGTVHRIDAYNSTRYFFPTLEDGAAFDDYQIFEVVLTNPTVEGDGTVSAYDAITPLEPVDTLVIGGIEMDGTEVQNLRYAPSYIKGTPTPVTGEESMIRTDTVTNTRVGGLRIIKTDADDLAMAGASFELKQGDEVKGTYTSAEDGLVTTAYLDDGVYTLTETAALRGYQAIETPVTITAENGTYTISEQADVIYNPESNTLQIRNNPFTLTFKKLDANEDTPLQDAHFALYRQVQETGGGTRKDYYPIEGYADLVSDEDGILPLVGQTLPPGTYYLTETRAPEGYELADPVDEVLFTVSVTGQITVQSGEGFIGVLIREDHDYTIRIDNGKTPNADLTIRKTVSGDFADPTQPFTFTLVSVEDETEGTKYAWSRTAADGTQTEGEIASGGTFELAHGESIVLTLPKNKEIVIREANGDYTATWTGANVDVDTSQAGTSAATVTLEDDLTLEVENHRDPVAPTGTHIVTTPYLLLLIAGCLLFLLGRRRKGGGADG